MDPTTDRRRSGRVRTRFDALYSAGQQEGAGVLADISYSGAPSRHDRYLAIQRIGPGEFKLKDFYRGRERRYAIGFSPGPRATVAS